MINRSENSELTSDIGKRTSLLHDNDIDNIPQSNARY